MLELSERELTAYHEAGHAIAYLSKGVGFRYITLKPVSKLATGMVRPYAPRKVKALDNIFYTLAGPAAEVAAFSLDEDYGLPREDRVSGTVFTMAISKDTHGEIREALSIMPGNDDLWLTAAAEVVHTAWPVVETVAQRLLASKRAVTFREVLDSIGAEDVYDAMSLVYRTVAHTLKAA